MTEIPRALRVFTRVVEGRLCAYDLASDAWGILRPAEVFDPRPGDEVVGHGVSSDLALAVYVTPAAAVCVTADGAELWRSAFEPPSTRVYGHRPGCVISLDDAVVWVYRPDAMAGRDRTDQWVVLDARTGTSMAATPLETMGHGGLQHRHPDGTLLLDVGEGQDGSVIYRGAFEPGGLDVVRYPWSDRWLIDVAPGGGQFMTVDHQQADVAFHSYPGGEVTRQLSVADLGHDPDEARLEWSGGYLSTDTAIVTLAGETDDGQEWFRYHRAEIGSGHLVDFDSHAQGLYDVQPVGDGSWLTTDPGGHPVRWRNP
jgi:hypothetical protein